MKENSLYEELLNDVSGGRVPAEDDFNDLLAAMEQTDGKRCRCCNKVFLKTRSFTATNQRFSKSAMTLYYMGDISCLVMAA